MLNTYSRQFSLYWEGGALVTDHVLLGGTKDEKGIRHSNFELTDGRWDALDTQVRYSYGICFSHDPKHLGVLRGTRLMWGESSDAIIMNGQADVKLIDSDFSVALHLRATGGTARFVMPVREPLNIVYDASNIPGARYRLELVDTQVLFWFLFAGGVSMDAPATTVLLEDCPSLILSIMGRDLQGTWQLPAARTQPILFEPDVTVGNVTFRTSKPSRIPCWGLYLQGGKTDVTLKGPTAICELMLWDGKVALEGGTPSARDARCSLTTVEVGNRDDREGKAELIVRDAELGRHDGLRGHLAAHKGGRVTIEGSLIQNADLIANPRGSIQINSSELVNCELQERGGQIQTRDLTSQPAQ